MQKKTIRMFSGLLAVFMLAVVIAPAYAYDIVDQGYRAVSPLYYAFTEFMEWKEDHPNEDESGFTGYRPSGTFGSEHHGGGFSQSDFDEEYNGFLSSLPAQSITSSGYLLWQPSYSNVSELRRYTTTGGSFTEKWFDQPFYSEIPITPASNGFSFSFVPSDFSIGSRYLCVGVYFYDFPISGTYSVFEKGICFSRYVGSTGNISEESYSFSGASGHLGPDSTIFWGCRSSDKIYSTFAYYSASIVFPIYKIIPDSVVDFDFTGSTYNVNTRPTSISGGNYGIVGDDGQITTVTDNSSIVNETNNTYYNPATGETGTINDWTYDYSNRTYTLTVDTGDTTTNESGDTIAVTKQVSVEYGDENIKIQENNSTTGDTITNTYTIYYLVQGSGTDTPTPTPHTHTWTETGSTPATCTAPGSREETCSGCGETKITVVPALGHKWTVKQTVNTQYDESGNLIQKGYTIYQCSVCGEQYKSEDGTAPPGGSGTTPGSEDKETIWDKIGKLFGAIGEGALGLIEAAVGKILDGLISLVEMINDKLKTVVETVLSFFDVLPTLFGGFLDFLGALFPYLPEEITMLLTFGVIVIVFIGIIKAVRR